LDDELAVTSTSTRTTVSGPPVDRPRFDRRTPTERWLEEAFVRGDLVDLRSGDAAADDPDGADGWGPELAGSVDLGDARVTEVRGAPADWPAETRLDGLVYDTLEPAGEPGEHLACLGRDPDGYQPRPYEQLAAFFRRIGREDDAGRVLLINERLHHGQMRTPGRVWGRIQDTLTGYGYRPWLAAVWLVSFVSSPTSTCAARERARRVRVTAFSVRSAPWPDRRTAATLRQ
jgi:hypothetical protein